MPRNTEATAAGVTLDSLSAGLQRQVKTLRGTVTKIAERFGVVRESLKDTAPKVMRLYNTIKAEHDTFSFVEFARMFAPDLPTHAADRDGVAGYRNHKVYYTLDYMRRMSNLRPRGRQGVRDSAVDGLARTLATVLQVIPAEAHQQVWKAIQDEFSYNERIMGRLIKRVQATQPIIKITVPAGRVKVGNVIHMERTTAEAGEAASTTTAEAPARGRARMARAS